MRTEDRCQKTGVFEFGMWNVEGGKRGLGSLEAELKSEVGVQKAERLGHSVECQLTI